MSLIDKAKDAFEHGKEAAENLATNEYGHQRVRRIISSNGRIEALTAQANGVRLM